MRALLQRVTQSKVTVGDRLTGEIGAGLVILLGVGAQDTDAELELLVNKIANLRIVPASPTPGGPKWPRRCVTGLLPVCVSWASRSKPASFRPICWSKFTTQGR